MSSLIAMIVLVYVRTALSPIEGLKLIWIAKSIDIEIMSEQR